MPLIIKLIEQQSPNLVFIDEAVFSSKSMVQRYWAKAGPQLSITKKQLSFTAVAVVAAINIKGQVVALHSAESSICTEDFIVFLNQMRRRRNSRKTYVLLDNLSFHHSKVVLERARKNKQEFIFNAAYSSE